MLNIGNIRKSSIAKLQLLYWNNRLIHLFGQALASFGMSREQMKSQASYRRCLDGIDQLKPAQLASLR